MSTTPTPGQLSGPERHARPTDSGCVARSSADSLRVVSWRAISTIAVAAALCATLTWTTVGPLAGVDLAVHDLAGAGDVGLFPVIVSSLLVAFAGGALLRWCQRRSAVGTRNWTILALLVAVVSLLGPTNADTIQAGMALVSLHSVVAAVVILGLTRSHRC